jgi:hypothetical protein
MKTSGFVAGFRATVAAGSDPDAEASACRGMNPMTAENAGGIQIL